MRESIEFLILDTIKKQSSIMALFVAGYSYSKVIEWVRQLEEEEKVCYNTAEQRILTDKGLARWSKIKQKKGFIILPLNSYKTNRVSIDKIYLP